MFDVLAVTSIRKVASITIINCKMFFTVLVDLI